MKNPTTTHCMVRSTDNNDGRCETVLLVVIAAMDFWKPG